MNANCSAIAHQKQSSRPIDLVLSRLSHVRRTGRDKGTAKCPAHDDQRNSLSWKEKPDGMVLVHCFSGCDKYAVMAAMGLERSDFFPDKPDDNYARPEGKRPAGKFPAPIYDVLRYLKTEIRIVQMAGALIADRRTDELSPEDLKRVAQAALFCHEVLEGLEL